MTEREQFDALFAAIMRGERNKAREECAKQMDAMAMTELCCDTRDDMARAAPYESAARTIRALMEPDTTNEGE